MLVRSFGRVLQVLTGTSDGPNGHADQGQVCPGHAMYNLFPDCMKRAIQIHPEVSNPDMKDLSVELLACQKSILQRLVGNDRFPTACEMLTAVARF